jgi:glutamine amidotransferase
VTVHLVDYGAGNLRSVGRAFQTVGADLRIVTSPGALAQADVIVVPGVGHFAATSALDADWRAALGARFDAGAPALGICLGMQYLFDGSTEAPGVAGLGRFAGRVVRFAPGVRVPHVGWNTLQRTGRPSALLDGLALDAAYFCHSFAAPVTDDAVATADHGQPFAAVVERGNLFGTQFHPEKSGTAGLGLIARFLEIARARRRGC